MNKISKKKIYGVVICYNSEPVIKDLYQRIDKELFDKIYFFDDNSTDNSYQVAKEFDWNVVKNQTNLGHGGNLKKAIKTAFLDGADYVLEIHADNQYNPNLIIKAKHFIEQDYALITGSRFINKNPHREEGMPFLRYFSNKVMSKFTRKLLSIDLSEFHTGFKIFGKNFYNKIQFEHCSNNYLFSFQIILATKFFNLKYGEISVVADYGDKVNSCNYYNGFIYLISNFVEIFFYLLAKSKIFTKIIYKSK
tara:strand:- start:2185 stop:2934 length:750 start_codon:yes stop_codon:yes gene_type:complete